MKIEVLGTRGKINPSSPKHKNHSGFLIDDKILIDVGEPEFLARNPQAIVFTHFHPDHGYFLYDDKKFTPEIPLYGPEENPLIPELEVITQKFNVLGYDFFPIPVIHALNLKSLGYVVEKDNKRIFFTGDVAWIEKAHLQEINNVDMIFTEATIIEKGGRINRKDNRIYGHTGVPDLVRILSPLTGKIVFTHFGDWFFDDPDKNTDRIREFSTSDLQVIPAYDGFSIKL